MADLTTQEASAGLAAIVFPAANAGGDTGQQGALAKQRAAKGAPPRAND